MSARALPIGFVLVGALILALCAGFAPRARINLCESGGAPLAKRAAKLVEQLPDDVRITHYVTDRSELPGTYDALPESVHDALTDLFQNTTRVELHSADPDAHPEWTSFLSAAGVRPWRARAIERDGWTERRLWSSLRIECGPSPAAVWNGIGPDDLPLFAPWVLGRLKQVVQPRRALIGLAAPPEYGVLRARLATLGEVIEVDMRATDIAGAPLDWLVWIDPGAVSADQLARFDDLLDAGCSALVAGSAWKAHEVVADGNVKVTLASSGFEASTFFAHFGLVADSLPLFDSRCATTPGPDGSPLSRPYRVRCIAPNQDFRELVGQPNGDLPFTAPTSFRLDSVALEARGWRATVIASGDETSYHPPVAEAELALADWIALPSHKDARAPLAAFLRSDDAWRGELAVFGASSAFADAALQSANDPPTALLRVLSDTLASDERLVRRALAEQRPTPLPELEAAERLRWRLIVIVAIPLLLGFATLLLRGGRASGTRTLRPLAPIAAGLVAIALLTSTLRARGFSISRDATPASHGIQTLTELLPHDSLVTRIYTVFSFTGDLPAELRGPAREAQDLCRAFATAIPGLQHEGFRIASGATPPVGFGIEPLAISSTLDERTTLRHVYSHVVVESGSQTSSIALDTPESFADLPFRLALSLDRLQRGTPRRLAVRANPPRLSPAEVELQYSRRGLHAPSGSQVYSTALNTLRSAGFEWFAIDASDSSIPEDVDALLWLQPKRDTLPTTIAMADHLARGGRALIAGQHHRVIARQRDVARGELRFWPQPQFCDLDQGYLPQLGVRLVREVLCDRLFATLNVSTEISDGADIELRRQSSAQPFMLRVPTSNRAPGFGGSADWVLPGANRWLVDAEQLAQRGLQSTVLAQTSSSAWAYAWTGGDLPPQVSTGTPMDDGSLTRFEDRQTLALELHGVFPAAHVVLERGPDGRELARLAVEDHATGTTGRLMLIGDAECFTDDYVRAGGGHADRALLFAVSELCLPRNITRLLPREWSSIGFGYVEPHERLLWRSIVVGLLPVLLLLFAFIGRMRS